MEKLRIGSNDIYIKKVNKTRRRTFKEVKNFVLDKTDYTNSGLTLIRKAENFEELQSCLLTGWGEAEFGLCREYGLEDVETGETEFEVYNKFTDKLLITVDELDDNVKFDFLEAKDRVLILK